MIRITKARRRAIFAAILILPAFVFLAVGAILANRWSVAIVMMIAWLFVFAFATSYVFQAVIALAISVFAFSQQAWVVGVISALLVPYLLFASRITDKDINELPARLKAVSPVTAHMLDIVLDKRVQWALVVMVVIFASVWVVIYFSGR